MTKVYFQGLRTIEAHTEYSIKEISKKLDLRKVSLICVTSVAILESIRSMIRSANGINFHDLILITNKESLSLTAYELIKEHDINLQLIPEINSINQYNEFMLLKLHKYFESEFCLICQWDSWVINISSWRNEFYKYDYIGAVWGAHPEGYRVGNGGFSLRSKSLSEATADLIKRNHINTDLVNEDVFISLKFRDLLEEKYGINFADEELANIFSIEKEPWNIVPFGFHGLFNFHRVLKPSDLYVFLKDFDQIFFNKREMYELVKILLKLSNFESARLAIKKRIKAGGWTKKNIKLLIYMYFFKIRSYVTLRIQKNI